MAGSSSQRQSQLSPDDSISKIKSRSTWPGPNANSNRKGTREAREPWTSYRSRGSKVSSQNGTAWSGSGPALTENNLEKFNEANEDQQSEVGQTSGHNREIQS